MVLACLIWQSLRTELAAWAEPALAILGILTLIGAIYSWLERRQTVNLQVARRARRVQWVFKEWVQHPSFDLTSSHRLGTWVGLVANGEDEVQRLLEEMLDLAGGASPGVQRATRTAYSRFLRGADVINNYGQPQLTGHAAATDQAVTARQHFEHALTLVSGIIPKDLL